MRSRSSKKYAPRALVHVAGVGQGGALAAVSGAHGEALRAATRGVSGRVEQVPNAPAAGLVRRAIAASRQVAAGVGHFLCRCWCYFSRGFWSRHRSSSGSAKAARGARRSGSHGEWAVV